MYIRENENLEGQTIELPEQAQFIRCQVEGMVIVENGFGWELLGCEGVAHAE